MRSVSIVAANYIFHLLLGVFFLNEMAFAKTAHLDVYPVISTSEKSRVFKIEQVARLKYAGYMADVDIAQINSINVTLPLSDFTSRQYLSGVEIKKAMLSALSQHDKLFIEVSVPPRVVVVFKTDNDVSANVVDVAKSTLNSYLGKHYQKFTISLIAAPDINHDDVQLRYVPRNEIGPIKKRTAVWVDVFSAEGLVQSVPVWFEVKAKLKVFVLKDAVTRGEVVNRSHFVIKSKDLNEIPIEAVQVDEITDAQFSDFVYAGNIPKQKILDRRLMKKTAAVNFGDDVKVISKAGRVSIITNAIAQGTADLGDNVKLMAVESKELFQGKVVARKQVVIDANP